VGYWVKPVLQDVHDYVNIVQIVNIGKDCLIPINRPNMDPA
jgi:hypothetical protein